MELRASGREDPGEGGAAGEGVSCGCGVEVGGAMVIFVYLGVRGISEVSGSGDFLFERWTVEYVVQCIIYDEFGYRNGCECLHEVGDARCGCEQCLGG